MCVFNGWKPNRNIHELELKYDGAIPVWLKRAAENKDRTEAQKARIYHVFKNMIDLHEGEEKDALQTIVNIIEEELEE